MEPIPTINQQITAVCPSCGSSQIVVSAAVEALDTRVAAQAASVACGGCGLKLHEEDFDPSSKRFAFLKLEHQRQRESAAVEVARTTEAPRPEQRG